MPSGIYQHKSHSEETKRKISLANRGKRKSEEHRKKLSEAFKGSKHTLGKHWNLSREVREKRSKVCKERGVGRWMKNRKLSEETKRKISEYQKKHSIRYWLGRCGKMHPNWRGGISFEPYSVDWTDDLRKAIRKRDRYTCQICGKEPSIYCHHIDYNKKNCDPKNLIILCRNCHSKTNFKREYWREVFKRLRPEP